MWKIRALYLSVLMLAGCAGLERGCSSMCAEEFGSDWIIVELTEAGGKPYRCWELRDVSITSEAGSDGIYWLTEVGNLIHVSGSYDYIQVEHNAWDEAFEELNLTREACTAIRAKRYDPYKDEYVIPESL